MDDNSEHKKTKGVNKSVVATLSHNEYKHVLWKKKCLRHSINRIQSKDHRIGTHEMSKTSLFCFDDKTTDVMEQLLVIRVNYKKQLS